MSIENELDHISGRLSDINVNMARVADALERMTQHTHTDFGADQSATETSSNAPQDPASPQPTANDIGGAGSDSYDVMFGDDDESDEAIAQLAQDMQKAALGSQPLDPDLAELAVKYIVYNPRVGCYLEDKIMRWCADAMKAHQFPTKAEADRYAEQGDAKLDVLVAPRPTE